MVVWLTVLAATAVGLLAATVATAHPPAAPPPGRAAFLDRWAALHGGYAPGRNRWVGSWLAVTAALAAPLARRGVHPDALTAWALWFAAAAVAAALPGGRWPLVAAVLVVVAATGDGLDGAVAAMTDRATAWGFVLDSAADRVGDALFVAAVWAAGGPAALAVAAGALGGLFEYVRARAAAAGMAGVGAVTVGERPIRVICCALALAGAGAAPAYAPALAAAGLGALAVLQAAGMVQLVLVVRRALPP